MSSEMRKILLIGSTAYFDILRDVLNRELQGMHCRVGNI